MPLLWGLFVYGVDMKKRVGLIGYPLGHSISPVFQQAAFDHLGIDAEYELWSTAPEDVKDASQLPVVTRRLLGDGYSREDIEKIWGKNALRVLREGWRT